MKSPRDGINKSNPSKPNKWPNIDTEAIQQVFLARVYCSKKEFASAHGESVDSRVKMLA